HQIIKAGVKIIIIHGGGSFGHPPARKYGIFEGINPEIPDQILGLVETHKSMNDFNTYIINAFIDNGYPALSIQSSSIFIKKSVSISMASIDIIEAALDLGITPVLYGDIILDNKGSFSIVSGDQIIFKLCTTLEQYKVSKVVFTMETDGLYIKDENKENGCMLITECHFRDLDSLELADIGQKIDVTGGIRGKLDFIKKICELKISVQLVNGLKEDFIYKALKNIEIDCTNILV
ncbi:MAG: isopentenyl phosphate kinase, partial [Promethearchaeota archaeon]